jgi:hypothetical protein
MASRVRLSVVPDKRGGGWRLKGAGTDQRFPNKEQAVRVGRQRAKANELGQLVVHKADGTIQTEYTYGADPRRTKG